MATFIVNTELDIANPNDDLLSLREAIAAANLEPGRDRILVSLFLDDPILVGTNMPELTDSVVFNGRGATLDTSDGTPFETGAGGLSITLKNLTVTAEDSGASLLVVDEDDGDMRVDDITVDTAGGDTIGRVISLEGEDNELLASDVDGTQAAGQFIRADGARNAIHMDDVDLTLGGSSNASALLNEDAQPSTIVENSRFVAGHSASVGIDFDHAQPFALTVENSRFENFSLPAILVDPSSAGGILTVIGNTFRGNGDGVGVWIQDAQDVDFRSSFNRYVDNDAGILIAGDVSLGSARSTFDIFRGNDVAIDNNAFGGVLVAVFDTFLGNNTDFGGSGDTLDGLFGF